MQVVVSNEKASDLFMLKDDVMERRNFYGS